MDEYPPDLITVVNYDSSGGELYLKSSAGPGMVHPFSINNSSCHEQEWRAIVSSNVAGTRTATPKTTTASHQTFSSVGENYTL